MLCNVCNKNDASIHYKSNINGKIIEKFLCRDCAAKEGIAKKTQFEPIDIIDDFFEKQTDNIFSGLFAGMISDTGKKNVSEPAVCPLCGMRFSEFLHGGKIGCGECYNTFRTSLNPTLKRIHANVEHCGKVPEGITGSVSDKKKIDILKQKLSDAIEKQEYEMAAKYRDEIKEIENRQGEEK